MSLTSQEVMSVKGWNETIRTEVEKAIGFKLDGSFIAANYAPGFNYDIREVYYNADSLAALDTLIVVSDDIPSIGQSYSALYKRVIDALEFGISSEDNAAINREANEQKALSGTIVDEYKNSGLDDEVVPYPKIMYIMNRIQEVTGSDYLHVDVVKYPNLSNLCLKLSEFARRAVFTVKLQNAWHEASERLSAISGHIEIPTEENGGLKTDSKTYNIGWERLPETEMLLRDLKSDNNISFSMEIESVNERESELSFTSGVRVKVPFSWVFNISADHEHKFDLSKYALTDSKLKVGIKFKGVTLFGAFPSQISNNKKKGWASTDILNEAAQKSGRDATGYMLHGTEFDPDILFGKNGVLRRIKTFVISQQPSVSLHFEKFDCESLSKVFSQKTNVSFSVLGGIINGTHENEYRFSDYNIDTSKQTLDVTLEPAPLSSAGSSAKQTAFVLGGVAEYYDRY